jgi:excisionase family DNA binding protein
MTGQSYSVAEIAALLKVRTHTVTALIHSGALKAIDVSLKGCNGQKPRWRVLSDDFDSFLMRRTLQIAGPRPRHRTKRRNVTEFF